MWHEEGNGNKLALQAVAGRPKTARSGEAAIQHLQAVIWGPNQSTRSV